MAELGSYQQAGVNYEVLDRVKSEAITRAKATSHLLRAVGGRENEASRGASAYVFTVGGQTFAMVVEGLGTKSVIAEEFLSRTGISRYADIAVDAVGTIVNDVVSVGAVPLVVTAYFSTGDAAWYADERRSLELLAGWQRACEESGATWGGGESPALPGLVSAAGIELGGSALGLVPAGREPVLGDRVEPGDRIVLLASSGLHANGASLARHVASELPDGLLTPLPSGTSLGAALLEPSVLYPRFVRDLLATDIRPRFLNGVTGHAGAATGPVRHRAGARGARGARLPRPAGRDVGAGGVRDAQHGHRLCRRGPGRRRGPHGRDRERRGVPRVRRRRGRRGAALGRRPGPGHRIRRPRLPGRLTTGGQPTRKPAGMPCPAAPEVLGKRWLPAARDAKLRVT
jgi:phosphoribosylformylglycinamidine cyclo-ligase